MGYSNVPRTLNKPTIGKQEKLFRELNYCSVLLENIVDNGLVIHDYNGFNIWVMGQKASTNVAGNDGKWHHMAFTWQSSSGAWKVYKDGSNVRQNPDDEPLQKGQVSCWRVSKPLRLQLLFIVAMFSIPTCCVFTAIRVIWLIAHVIMMKQILCRDWLPAQSIWRHLDDADFPLAISSYPLNIDASVGVGK